MNRNEYRRAFIMLRSVIPGYGGHVRLERRTLTGSMYFIVTAPQGVNELAAALAGQRNGEYFAAPIGPLTRDRRGQLSLAWQFDPRAIDGRPLEAYNWVVVAATGGPCAVALTGNVEGSRPVDLLSLGRAVCPLFEPARAPAADLPSESATPTEPALDDSAFVERQTRFEAVRTPQEEAVAGETTEVAQVSEAAGVAQEGEVMRGDVRIYTLKRSRPRSAERRRITPQEPPAEPAQPTEPVLPAAEPEAPQPTTAAKALGLDITEAWPGRAESLRRLFATQAPAQTPLEDGFTYVRTPMPAGSGYEGCLTGLRVEDGRVAAIRYALPARQSPEPPAGLEGYTWTPTGGAEGYWVMEERENF